MENKELEKDKHTIDELFQRSMQFKNSKEYWSFFNFIGKIIHYSHYNAMLIYMQDPTVRYFGTPGYWKKTFDRTVNEGAKPYVIIVPFGPAALAYNLYETSGELTPDEFLTRGFKGELFQIKGDIPKELYTEIKKGLIEYKIYVDEVPMPFNKNGETDDYSNGTIRIKISNRTTPAQAFATLIHELAHNFLGHMGNKTLIKETIIKAGKNKGKRKIETIQIEGRTVGHDIREIEAETVSYVICSRWNLEQAAEKYISPHISEENMKKISPETIIRVADKIEDYFLKRFK